MLYNIFYWVVYRNLDTVVIKNVTAAAKLCITKWGCVWDWTLDFQWKTGPIPKSLLLVQNHDKWKKNVLLNIICIWGKTIQRKNLLKITKESRSKGKLVIEPECSKTQFSCLNSIFFLPLIIFTSLKYCGGSCLIEIKKMEGRQVSEFFEQKSKQNKRYAHSPGCILTSLLSSS